MGRARHWAWLTLASALLLPQVCLARVPTRLVYARAQSAKDCPDEQTLVDAVAARLAYDPFSPWGDQTILATVSRAGSSVLGRAELIDHDGIAQGTREVKVQGGDCRELILALSLAISITLDPLHVDAAATEPEAEPPAAVEESVATETSELPEPAPVSRPRDVPRRSPPRNSIKSSWHVSGGALTAYALAPRVTLGARVGLAVRRVRWSLALEGWTVLPTAWALEGGGQLRASLWAGAIAPCFEVLSRLRLCALGSVGSLRSESFGITSPRSERVLHAAAGGRANFSWPVGQRFELVANADVAAALNRPRFQLDGAEVWRPSPLLAVLSIDATVRFF
jgi:hypothetical protein